MLRATMTSAFARDGRRVPWCRQAEDSEPLLLAWGLDARRRNTNTNRGRREIGKRTGKTQVTSTIRKPGVRSPTRAAQRAGLAVVVNTVS